MSIRVRFAPAPTGQIHIGNIRTAIFNWLFARHEGGKFLLRIEDTDRERWTAEAERGVFGTMDWLGLDYDEDPFRQSSHMQAHLAAAEVAKKGLAYREDKGGTGKGECTVFKMPEQDMVFHDEIKGELRKEAKDLQDFVIVRSDGTPLFHLANIVDDIQMKITHIIRGVDHVENTYRHVALYKAMGAEPPKYAHLPLIVNQQGKPYSKRDGAFFVGEFERRGFHAEALFNYLSLLGWSPGDDSEKMAREDLVGRFSLDRVKSSPAQMDMKKLLALNREYVTEEPLERFAASARKTIAGAEWTKDIDEGYFLEVCRLMQSRTHLYTYATDWHSFFSEDFTYEEKAVRKVLGKPGVKEALAAVVAVLEPIEFSTGLIEDAIHRAEGQTGFSEGKLNQPIRVAITGLSKGAGVYETMALLGKAKVLARLKRATELIPEAEEQQV